MLPKKSLSCFFCVERVRAVSHSCREIEKPKYLYYLLLFLKISKYFQHFQYFLCNEAKNIFLTLELFPLVKSVNLIMFSKKEDAYVAVGDDDDENNRDDEGRNL